MTSYLRAGWFERSSGKGAKGLRTEVIDGAMDAAGILLRAGIDGATVLRVALRTRALMAIADPRMLGVPKFTDRERTLIMNGLARHSDAAPELYAFVADCVDRVDNLVDLMAFYLHLTHVARMIELLSVAQRTTPKIVPVTAQTAKVITKEPSAAKATKSKAAKTKAAAKKPGAQKTVQPARTKAAAAEKPVAQKTVQPARTKAVTAKKSGAKRATKPTRMKAAATKNPVAAKKAKPSTRRKGR